MIQFPFPCSTGPGDMTVSFYEKHSDIVGGMTVGIIDEGGDYFVTLKTEGIGVSLTPEELRALSAWCVAACAEMGSAKGRA